ncbi:MAG: hypothetical protein ABW174_10790 [Flavitalea sp.]
MNRFKILIGLFVALILTSCNRLEEEVTQFKGNFVEIDATVLNAPLTGKAYPLLTRIPQGGRPVINAQDSLIRRTTGTVQLRVNLVAAQRNNAEVLTFRVIPEETTAQAGVHYQTTGTVEIPANSSFGFITVQILDPGAGTGSVNLVVELESSTSLKANPNYNQVGIAISQN